MYNGILCASYKTEHYKFLSYCTIEEKGIRYRKLHIYIYIYIYIFFFFFFKKKKKKKLNIYSYNFD
ncbi:hypothetical protein C923_02635 [Plasmodium falciparum UGT5.1]|uniref:Uncharacterized protein n=1 Tax=Plasmodium falciparum UGT5.1 TaxID=1237627 RepID=W7JCU7_PLAFA|nr:hypothetical protein C923_02635 [Plasmodium falciparum UGT5.1]